MTRDEIIGLAKQAGFLDLDSLSRKIHDGFYHGFPREERIHICNDERIERFAALVAEAAAAAEREACAKIVDVYDYARFSEECAAAIRARGEKGQP